MKVLVTRPLEDALRTSEALIQRGYQPVVSPLTEIHDIAVEIPRRRLQAVLATSANAMRALDRGEAIKGLRALPLLAVGDASAEAARRAGFSDVVSAAGAATDLVRLVRERLDRKAGPVLYPSGLEVASDLSMVLGAEGYEVERLVIYEARAMPELPATARSALRGGGIGATLVYSPRSARILGALGRGAGLLEELAAVQWICISDAAAEAARASGARRILVANHPHEAALLDALEGVGLATAPPKRV